MRYRELINDEEYAKEKKDIRSKITALEGKLSETKNRAVNWLDVTEKVFSFATTASEAFKNGSLETKKEILLALGENPTLTDVKLKITPHE